MRKWVSDPGVVLVSSWLCFILCRAFFRNPFGASAESALASDEVVDVDEEVYAVDDDSKDFFDEGSTRYWRLLLLWVDEVEGMVVVSGIVVLKYDSRSKSRSTGSGMELESQGGFEELPGQQNDWACFLHAGSMRQMTSFISIHIRCSQQNRFIQTLNLELGGERNMVA